MKIGEFAKKHNVSVDRIRHYMDLELLLPQKLGGHYSFTKEDSTNLVEILELKKMNFSLTEIQQLFAYKRLTAMKTNEDQLHFKRFLETKKNALLLQQIDLEKTIQYLQEKIEDIQFEDALPHGILGIPLSFIPSIYCPLCNKSLLLIGGRIENNMLIEGSFQCDCGYSAKVAKGILISLDHEDIGKITPIDQSYTTLDYVMNTSTKFINFMYRAINTVKEALKNENLANSVILELGTGSGIFLRQILEQLPVNTFYIITDHDLKRIQGVKNYLQRESIHKNFVFLCTDFEKLPLASASIDYAIDYWGSVTYNPKATKFLPDVLAPKIKQNGKYLGIFVCFNKLSQRLKQLPEENRCFYRSVYLQSLFEKSHYKTLEYKELGSIDEAGIYEPLIDGGSVSELYWCGEKRR
ncbi:DNA-binding transcriptional MerR regulator [Anaerosolibacter carboniphilus]|uniref:DNA-binding transcriptional MerR regulator n=1 Tax=Anaerosolibacter carboniphilus TaxID=1417629 RepID=A0A841KUQ8_9FIRM|nr:MerR family transcriptional regulator [Anaerosolibacter carboniphilus]MBB6217103.1 DNA-binding transcriptional MerR regulator [Anaerosolibacter carboniphilus]